MIKVAGVWEQGWIAPYSEFDLWHFPLREFKVDEWYMSPVSGMAKRGKLLTEVPGIVTAIIDNPDLTPVYVDEEGETFLADFDHPADVLYIFGRAGFSPWKVRNGWQRSIRIETPAGGSLLWPHQCVPLVLYDRERKQ